MRTAFSMCAVGVLMGLVACGGGSGSTSGAPLPPTVGEPEGFAATPSFITLQNKMQSGQPVTVAFLGGSITVGATTQPLVDPGGAYDYSSYVRERDSWRGRVFESLEQDHAQAPGQFRMINASLSGSGSNLGAYRYERDVAQHAPDLLFIEFAVNDTGVSTLSQDPYAASAIQRTLLSIVEQARSQNPDVAIFMTIATVRRYYNSASPEFIASRQITLDTAIHLEVPYADMTTAFYDSTLPPGFDQADLYGGPITSPNSLHPSPTGHQLFALHVSNELGGIFEDGGFVFAEPTETLPDDLEPWPVRPDLVEPVDLSSNGQVGFSLQLNQEDWVQHPIFEGVQALFVDQTDVTLEQAFVGSAVAVWWEWDYGDEAIHGGVEVTLDGSYLGRFVSDVADPTTEQRLSRFMQVADGLDPNVVHTLELRIPINQPTVLPTINLALLGLCIDEG